MRIELSPSAWWYALSRSELWRSIIRHGVTDSSRNRSLAIFQNFFLHMHPVKVRRKALEVRHTYYLGGISLALTAILAASGIFLMFYYHPSVPEAYMDMKELQFTVDIGAFLRNLHRWSAHAMVLVVFLHMLRVFYHGAFRPPRQFNWVLGVVLLTLTLLLSYTGYLLPWDQLAYWAVTVGTNMVRATPVLGERIRFLLLGGNIVGANALIRFYVLHCVALPLLLVVIAALHIWRVRKDGGVKGPLAEDEETLEVYR